MGSGEGCIGRGGGGDGGGVGAFEGDVGGGRDSAMDQDEVVREIDG